MMALTGIVFAIAFVMVQFSAVAYSPRLVIMFASNPILFHTLGIFFATFTYSLAALNWTDRSGSGAVPLFSTLLVGILLIVSMLAFSRLVQSLSDLQIHNVLRAIGTRGRTVIREMFPYSAGVVSDGWEENSEAPVLGPVTQTLVYTGEPYVIASFDTDMLVGLAQSVNGVMAIECGVGETLAADTVPLRVYGAKRQLPERTLLRGIRLATSCTFEQDPQYAIRLLVDVAIRALSPAVNDPTTAVQALDQVEDLLRRLGGRQLDHGQAFDTLGMLRRTFPAPTWEGYLALSFDEIRQYGATSIQVVRRLRAALVGLADTIVVEARREAVRRYLDHLNGTRQRHCRKTARAWVIPASGLRQTAQQPILRHCTKCPRYNRGCVVREHLVLRFGEFRRSTIDIGTRNASIDSNQCGPVWRLLTQRLAA
jgi:uncharacterized membrane protein